MLVAPLPARAQEITVTMRFRQAYAICIGVCPHFEMTIEEPGRITTRHLSDGETTRFEVPERDWVRSIFILHDLMREDRQLDTECPQATNRDGSPDELHDPKPDDIEVTWTEGQRTTRVTGCASNLLLRTALRGAMEVLGVDWASGKQDDS